MLKTEDFSMYSHILKEELVPALGCTEPIAVALAAAVAVKALGAFPCSITAFCSGNIIKNVMGVTVPNCGGLKGVAAAAIIGAVGGDCTLGLEVLKNVTEDNISLAKRLVADKLCKVRELDSDHNLHIILTVHHGDDSASAEIADRHTNIIKVTKNGKALYECGSGREPCESLTSRTTMCMDGILEYANTTDLSDLRPMFKRQIEYNTAIANEGLCGKYGACVGKTLLSSYGSDVKIRARAMPAAGSDARMSGCVLPVITNSGSGNQGMTASLPVIEYAKEYNIDDEHLYRALIVSNLTAIHQKTRIGRLSAYCGAVSAACGAGAGISYMLGGDNAEICATITNTLGNVAGMICDGAKPSCAAKISSAVDAAILGYHLAKAHKGFCEGEGIIKDDIEKTIAAVGRLGHCGMRRTDTEIIAIMTGD
ncbi:MAG: L-serine ammonia-lyase, iron-sulfur-dependent, subunit alpha [Oscillospiraceae bacterium]